MGAAVQARAAGEQAISIGNVAHILTCSAGCHNGTGTAVLPQIHIMLRVKSHDTLTGGAGSGLNPHAVLQGHTQQAIGIGLPQIVLAQKRQLVQIRHTLDIRRRHTLFFHFLPVVRHIVPNMLHLSHQPLILQLSQLIMGHSLNFLLVVISHKMLLNQAFLPKENAVLFSSRNLGGTLSAIACSHSSSEKSKFLDR